jgi:hypothetical protein
MQCIGVVIEDITALQEFWNGSRQLESILSFVLDEPNAPAKCSLVGNSAPENAKNSQRILVDMFPEKLDMGYEIEVEWMLRILIR